MKSKKEVDCTKSCRMTRQLRESEFCTGTAEVVGERIAFGCQKKLLEAPKNISNHYSCNLWNMEVYDACNICEIECVKNKNDQMDEIRRQRVKINKLKQTMNPLISNYGIGNMEDVSKKYQKAMSDLENTDLENIYGREVIKTAEFASGVLNAAFSGKQIDLVYFKDYTNNLINNLKRMDPSLNIKEIDFKKKEAAASRDGIGKFVIGNSTKPKTKK